ncbi:MAG: hypothetical protein ACI8RD_006014 [Bacillariaceae sp.]|jgi:hypothetical protein
MIIILLYIRKHHPEKNHTVAMTKSPRVYREGAMKPTDTISTMEAHLKTPFIECEVLGRPSGKVQ